jgi:SH3 domain protein
MKSFWRLAGSLLIVLTCWTATVWAETRYISDQLVVSLREQPQKGAATITYLKTDMSVEVLEEAGEYTKVQTTAGEIGYIQRKYLTAATPKKAIIKKLQQERDRLATKTGEMEKQAATATSQSNKSQQELATQLDDVRKQVKALQNALAKSQADLKQTSQSYQALQNDANNITAIIQERDQLRKTNHELSTAITSLDEEVGELTKTGVIKWFLAGAGVLFFGWVIGKASGNRRRRLL